MQIKENFQQEAPTFPQKKPWKSFSLFPLSISSFPWRFVFRGCEVSGFLGFFPSCNRCGIHRKDWILKPTVA
ncbi:hypothetical protein CKAN_00098000 [Cinnamomum micranthum f. kanehirae]|uniref:Uncharacterized protein n=1 Tax=Cinnamomum micranthum f. kanehirae TaxID=337451 RepID=A0A443N2L1_9MAGN|nr:hypothetical protein CKAN_00098000 [Cinnamomum micranthum f. kanehirae]